MPVLANPKHELFAQELAKGLPASTAYVTAGYRAHDGNAARLSGNERVRARVDELQAAAASTVAVTVADIIRQLDEDRAFAKERGSAAAMVSASLGKAKLLGLIKERHEHTGRDGAPIEYRNLGEDEIDARLRNLTERHGLQPLAH